MDEKGVPGYDISVTGKNVLNREVSMLRWSLVFLIVALVAGALGLTGVEGLAVSISKILFVIFLAGFLLLLVMGLAARSATR
jgi:uncharacterized membrane protein YtjA (UPF0391 family)